MEPLSEKEENFFFRKLQEEFPKVFSLANFVDLPFDEQNIRYFNWKDVYNNMLERKKEDDKFLKLPQDIFNFLVLSISFEKILDFLNKICSHKPSYCNERQYFWILLWKRDINNYPPPFGIKEKYLAFADEFNKETDEYFKLGIAAKFGAVNHQIFISAFNAETDIQEKFYLAAKFGAIDLIKDLINQGADISAGDYEVLCSAAENGHLEVVRFLANLDPEGIKANDYAPLRLAAENGHLEVVRVLAYLGPEGIKANNYGALRSAVLFGHLEVVRFLADLDPEGIKADDYEALRSAARYGRLEVVRLLTVLDPEGIKAYNYEALRLAAANGQLEIVRFLADLDSEGVKANNYDALRLAALYGHLEVVRFLADLGPEGVKANNYDALHSAAKRGHLEMVRYLLSKIENISEIPDNIKILIRDKFDIFI